MLFRSVVHDFYELDPELGISGGGGMDFRFDLGNIGFALAGLGAKAPTWGPAYKRLLRERYNRTVYALAHLTSLPVATNRVDLDPTLKDAWGLPAMRVTHASHPNDTQLTKYFLARGLEWLQAAGARETDRKSVV